MVKKLNVSLVITSDDTFSVEIFEPESSDFMVINCHDKGENVERENKAIIEEIRSWVAIMRDEMEDEKNDHLQRKARHG